ncbi:MAG: hypothetical protein QOJ64_2221 [Acidobacteriota bacterium]|jgi:hypothetical protein|nr:hypothetical protein [Acidobacteriota bacterium]
MTEAVGNNGNLVKGEGLLLNAVCLVMAALFLGLAALNFFNAGNFISTDSLFFTTVSGLMAFIFLLVPLTSLLAARKAKKAASQPATAAATRPALAGARQDAGRALPPVRYADAVDAKGRRIPPDVARMVEIIKDN